MQFANKYHLANYGFMRHQLLRDAKSIIIRRRVKPTEYKLNKYLIDNYKLDLIQACLYLLKKCKTYYESSNEIIVLFPDKKDDQLAALITYGNLECSGSNILKEAFGVH